jgi:hypothetical protein
MTPRIKKRYGDVICAFQLGMMRDVVSLTCTVMLSGCTVDGEQMAAM